MFGKKPSKAAEAALDTLLTGVDLVRDGTVDLFHHGDSGLIINPENVDQVEGKVVGNFVERYPRLQKELGSRLLSNAEEI